MNSESRLNRICVAGFGHSIGVDNKGVWHPSSFLQPVDEVGTGANGFKKFRRTGILARDLWDESSAIVGGGMAVVAAMVELIRNLNEKNEFVSMVAHIGGKAAYLSETSPSKAEVMANLFNRRADGLKFGSRRVNQRIVSTTKTTEHDMRTALNVALKYKCDKLQLVCLNLRRPRAEMFIEGIKLNDRRYNSLETSFVSAENILSQKAEKIGRLTSWQNLLKRFYSSPGYQRTVAAEEQGIIAYKSGNYGQVWDGTGRT